MIRFADPSVLQLLWFAPAFLGFAAVAERRLRARLNKAFGQKAPALTAGASPARRRAKLWLFTASFAFLVLALARPQSGRSSEKIKSEGVEIVFAVDVSNSMLAEDVKPSRLEHAKAELARLLDLLGGDKVGIVAFAGSATLVSPLTSDKGALKMFLESLSPRSVETQGTEFRKALREANSAFDRGGIETDSSSKVTRVVLVASDGEDQEPGALDEARRLTAAGVRVFAMAYGTEKGAPIPVRDERGYMTGYKRDRSGQTVQTQVKGDFLRALAQTGRGAFYHVTFGGNEAQAIRSEIDKLEKTQFDSELSASYDERYQIPLLMSILLGLLELAMGERGGGVRKWRGRFTGRALPSVPVVFSAAFSAVFLAAFSAEASELGGAWNNNRGVSRFRDGKPSEAHRRFSDAVADLPEDAQIHPNLGASFSANKEFEKALEEFAVASRMAKSPGEKFAALFGAGTAAGELKQIDEALDWYQKALAVNPRSQETKTNIELLVQSGKGGSDDKSADKPDDKPKEGKDDQKSPPKQADQPKPTPRPYDGKDLSQEDVKKILDELKQQEEQVRAKYQREGIKDAPRAKDW